MTATHPASPATQPTERCPSEQTAHAMLLLVADHPGRIGRLRCARIVGGYAVPHRDEQQAVEMHRYARKLDWPLRDLTALVDALLTGGLIAQSNGPRPLLVLTRSGHRALEALDAQHAAGQEQS